MFWKEAPHLLALAMELKKGLFIGLSKETPSPVPPKVKMANTKSASFCLLPGVWAQDPDRLHSSKPLPSSSGKLMVWEARPAGLVTGP